MRRALLSIALLVGLAAPAREASAQGRSGPAPRADDLARARALDQQGAKAYADGRYNDAIRYFEEAYRLGGPPFELWNIAKCHLRLDQPEEAAEVLERYLATPDLPPEDREEAVQQLEALRSRPSTLTVSSSPTGAAVEIDGKPQAGTTPVSVSVGPGRHTVTVKMEGRDPWTKEVEARYGRAVIVDAPLARDSHAPPPNPYVEDASRKVALRAVVGAMIPRHGAIGGETQVGLLATGTYALADLGSTRVAVGAALHLTGDSWRNTIGAPVSVAPCGALRSPNEATALSAFALGTAGWELASRLRASTLVGLGLAGYFADQLGGDLFVPTCDASPGVQPAALFGAQLDYAVTPAFRLTAMPIALQLQRAFAGARTTPIDTNGLWLRATIAVGIGFDL